MLLAKFLAAGGRLYPLYSGCLKLANSKLFRWALSKEKEMVWVRLRGGAGRKYLYPLKIG